MSNCHKCYWADRDPNTHIQAVHMEPDYLNPNVKPGASPPDIRIVQSCGDGAKFYKSFGAQDHNCNKFVDESEQQEADKEAIEDERAKWRSPTSRLQLPGTKNIMLVIEKMIEGNNKAFDILTDLMATHFDELVPTITHLDDMNIRGEQIALAYKFCESDLPSLIGMAQDRDVGMIKYVNIKYADAKNEKAVQRGAHLYGHLPAKKKVLLKKLKK